MKRTVVRAARLGIGSLLVLVGVISGFVPILQGWIFILAGLSIMAPESERARRVLDWAKKKFKRGDAEKTGDEQPPSSRTGDGAPRSSAQDAEQRRDV
ncbi:MAG TPA: PGPGW domain-containing protein [Candidatus Limnocylindrales bacterium]|nr:PGPGW domain-containing protein [Candidatus Limnocylindrales bacterium]